MFFEVTHRFIHDPRVPNAPASGSTKSTPPQETYSKFPRSRGTANPRPSNASSVDRVPAALAPSPSAASASVPTPIAVPDSAENQPALPQLLHPIRRDPAGSARSFWPSAPDDAPREKPTHADCLSASPAAGAETAREKPPERSPRRDRPSSRATKRIEATDSYTHQRVE